MEQALRALLQGSAAVTALVPAASINWRRHPQGAAWPGIVLHLINGSHLYGLSDVTDLSDCRVQINCLGATYAQAKGVARAVAGALSGYRGNGFSMIRLIGERDMERTGIEEPGEPVAVMLDFIFHFTRT